MTQSPQKNRRQAYLLHQLAADSHRCLDRHHGCPPGGLAGGAQISSYVRPASACEQRRQSTQSGDSNVCQPDPRNPMTHLPDIYVRRQLPADHETCKHRSADRAQVEAAVRDQLPPGRRGPSPRGLPSGTRDVGGHDEGRVPGGLIRQQERPICMVCARTDPAALPTSMPMSHGVTQFSGLCRTSGGDGS